MKFKFQKTHNKQARLGYFYAKIFRKHCRCLDKDEEGLL